MADCTAGGRRERAGSVHPSKYLSECLGGLRITLSLTFLEEGDAVERTVSAVATMVVTALLLKRRRRSMVALPATREDTDLLKDFIFIPEYI